MNAKIFSHSIVRILNIDENGQLTKHYLTSKERTRGVFCLHAEFFQFKCSRNLPVMFLRCATRDVVIFFLTIDMNCMNILKATCLEIDVLKVLNLQMNKIFYQTLAKLETVQKQWFKYFQRKQNGKTTFGHLDVQNFNLIRNWLKSASHSLGKEVSQ